MMKRFRNPAISIGIIAGFALAFAVANVSTAGTAIAATSGIACLINAPKGAPLAGGLIKAGHVGWAFSIGGGQWVYGATEGIQPDTSNPAPPSASRSWMHTGSFEQMLNDFGTGVGIPDTNPADQYFKAGYYQYYRCTNVKPSNPTVAYNEALTVEGTGYQLTTNNCLTKAVQILSAYGANMPSAYALGVSLFPDPYYTSTLDQAASKWTSAKKSGPTRLTVGVQLEDPLDLQYYNTTPLHPRRPMTIQVLNQTTGQLQTISTNASVLTGTDKYVGELELPGLWPSTSTYLVNAELNYTLYGTPQVVTVLQGQNVTVPDEPLLVGDINQDGVINSSDYNIISSCFGAQPTGSCQGADLDDNGTIDGVDYNIWLRVCSFISCQNNSATRSMPAGGPDPMPLSLKMIMLRARGNEG